MLELLWIVGLVAAVAWASHDADRRTRGRIDAMNDRDREKPGP